MYNFIKVEQCNICDSNHKKHTLLGKRFSRSQGFFFKEKKDDLYTNIYKCKLCSTIFCNPLPIPLDDYKRYENLNTEQMLNFDLNIFNYELSIIKKYLKKDKIKFLDIGCGNGYLLNKLHTLNIDVYGIEPVKKFYDLCLNKFPFLKNKIKNIAIENLDLKNVKYDIISFNSVLEHILDPTKQIKSVLKNLSDEGIIHIEVPNSNWLISRLINIFKIFTFQNNVTNLSPMHPPFHYYEFSINSFKQNGYLQGYKVIDYYYRVSDIEFNIPIFLKKLLKYLMKKTGTGKQIVVFIKKL